jgi:hypothetical protein
MYTVTTGPLNLSNCQIHFRSRCRFVARARSDSGKSRLGPASPDAGHLEEELRLFVQLAFTEPPSL